VSNPAIGLQAENGLHDLFAATGLRFALGAMRTFYCRSRDTIILSDWRSHRDIADFYRDWIHELVHATGHGSRLRRDLPPVFGSRVDAMEDLIAEMGSALVCARLGLAPALRHPDGIPAWIALLHGDSHAWSRAVRAAHHAADYLFALRDAQAAAFDRIDAEEVLERAIEVVEDQAGRRRRQSERERWAFGAVTGSRPGESLPAARSGDLP
jgi:antirestriction protein ArdC